MVPQNSSVHFKVHPSEALLPNMACSQCMQEISFGTLNEFSSFTTSTVYTQFRLTLGLNFHSKIKFLVAHPQHSKSSVHNSPPDFSPFFYLAFLLQKHYDLTTIQWHYMLRIKFKVLRVSSQQPMPLVSTHRPLQMTSLLHSQLHKASTG